MMTHEVSSAFNLQSQMPHQRSAAPRSDVSNGSNPLHGCLRTPVLFLPIPFLGYLRVVVLIVTFATLPIAFALGQGTSKNQPEEFRQVIDREVKAGWESQKLTPPKRSSDSVFLRRIYLDLVGVIPTYDQTVDFLANKNPNKREKLIDQLLNDPRYPQQQAQLWDVALLGRNPMNIGTFRNREGFRKWLAVQFHQNEPYDRFVAKLLRAEEEGSQLFFAAHRNTDELTTAVTRLFLGTQLQCAKCHDHPFEPWTQKDYHGMAGFFVRTFVVDGGGPPNDKRYFVGEKSTGDVLFSLPSKDPKVKSKGEPVKPKFLGGVELKEPQMPMNFKEPKLKNNEQPPKPAFSRREKVVDWITQRSNPYLAKVAVNRVWAQYMGRGLVHPVDDFNSQNDPSRPELLKELADQFVQHHFDLKWLVREIVNSQAYQAADTGPATEALPIFYERARVRPLSAEELTASLGVATGHNPDWATKNNAMDQVLKFFGEPTDGQGRFQGTLAEHLFLNNSDQLRGLCQPRKDNFAEKLVNGTESWDTKVDRMFLAVLNRKPTDVERMRFVKHLQNGSDTKATAQRIEEALWALVSCSEFRFHR